VGRHVVIAIKFKAFLSRKLVHRLEVADPACRVAFL
jgi:hypothetical protein